MLPALYRANAAFLLRHPWQLAMALLGVGIGVAVIVAVDLANASARKAFLLSMDAVTGEATHQVVGGPRGIPERVYADLRVAGGIRAIAPVVAGPVDIGDATFEVFGVDVFAEQAMRAFTGTLAESSADDASGQAFFRDILVKPGATVMAATAAASLGLAVGERFGISAGGRRHEAFLLGTYADAAAPGLGEVLTTDIATAQEWLGSQGYLSRIDVRLPDDAGATRAAIERRLPSDARLLGAAGRTQSTADMSKAFMTNLQAMSLLALLVGLFLIYNSVSFSVLQRRPLLGVLRALGVTRGQAFALVMTEAGCLGVIASVAGVAGGIWLGDQLLALVARSINDLFFRVSVTDVAVDGFTVAKGLIAGIGAALVAATVPALEASSYAPRLSLMRSVLERRTGRLLPRVALAGLAVMLAAVIVLAISGRSLVAGLTAVFMLILGFALCVPLAVGVLTRLLAPAAARLGGVWSRLAVQGIGASLSRTGVAIVALAVAVSATIGVTVMVDSFRGSVGRWIGQTLRADIYAGVSRGDMDPGLIAAFAAVDGVDAVSTTRRAWLEDDTGRLQIRAVDMAPGSYAGIELLDARPAAVWPAFDAGTGVLVSEPHGYRHGIGGGDAVSLRTAAGDVSFEILATYQSYDINASAVLMSRAAYDRYFDDPGIDSVGLYLGDGVAAEDVIARLESLSSGRQDLLINSNTRIRELTLEIFDRTFVITDVLYWLALGVALVGILGAMLALQLERARELAILRAVGMTPALLGGMIVLQTATIGLLAGIAAIPLGIVMAFVLIEVINRRAFGWQIDMALAPGILVTATLFAVLAALIAGLYPAWRAARSVPALAMREE
jgi:putative ABC transport system permease protein